MDMSDSETGASLEKMGWPESRFRCGSTKARSKIEYQTTALSLNSVHLSPDHQITEVTNPRRLETRFRSSQLDLWQLSDTEWLLALRRPEPNARRKRSKVVALAEQLVLPEFSATG
jgi:hypothetical protein